MIIFERIEGNTLFCRMVNKRRKFSSQNWRDTHINLQRERVAAVKRCLQEVPPENEFSLFKQIETIKGAKFPI